MAGRDLLAFAWMALTGHRVRTALSVLGVAIGVAAVILLTALGEGARRYVINQFSAIGSNLVGVIPGKTETTGAMPGFGGVPHDLTLEDARVLRRQIPVAQLVVPVSLGTETVSYGERRRQVPVVGTTAEFIVARELSLEVGSFLPPGELFRGSRVVVLGNTVAKELFPGASPIGQAVRVGEWRMRVIGVLAKQGTQLAMNPDEIVVVPVATGMRMFNRSSLFRIMIKVHSARDVDAACKYAVTILTERHTEEDVTCITQDAVITTFSSILRTLTLVLAGIAAISLSVAGIGIMNVMLVSVSERTEEVGLLRALGVTRGQVLAVFLTEAMLLAGIGGLVGIGVGWGGVIAVGYWYPAFPVQAPPWAILSAWTVAIGIGAIFGVIPARRAARLDPLLALERR